MKVTIELTKEDDESFQTLLNKFRGDEWKGVVEEFLEELRTHWKYREDEVKAEFAEELKGLLLELIDERGLSIY